MMVISCFQRTKILLPLVTLSWCFVVVLPSSTTAQVSTEDHAKHHPGQDAGSAAADGSGTKGDNGGGMMGGAMGGMMDTMMEKMGAPKPKEMYPQLMDLPDLPLEERFTIKQEAHQRMLAGTSLLSVGLDRLSAGAATDDFQMMQDATARMREGLSQFESGLAAQRAIAEGKAPRNVAMQWFKREMNLLASPSEDSGFRILGMTVFHTSIMVVLVTFAAVMIWMYFFKMQRAAALIEKLSTVSSPSESQSPVTPTVVEETLAPAVPSAQNADAKTAAIDSDCCDESGVACATEDAIGDRSDISSGILPVAKRKLCRLRVARIYQETHDVKTFRLVACHGGALPFNYLPGQFLTLTLPTSEKSIRRSYTISSSPTQGYYCEITVKREDQGAGSRYLHDCVKETDTLEVQAPSGKFTFTGQDSESVVLIGGGVGITPMMSITRALTDMAYPGQIHVVVACRDPNHFIFSSEFRRLQEGNPNLHVDVAMSRIQQPIDGCHAGRLSKELLLEWIPDISSKLIFLCGSPPMMDSTKQLLGELGVPADRINTENFGSLQKPQSMTARHKRVTEPALKATAATVNFATSGKSTQLLPDETLLEAAERVEVDIDYSCRTGMCGVCAVKLLSGVATMDVEDGLEPGDKASGMVLACQAKSTNDVTVEA